MDLSDLWMILENLFTICFHAYQIKDYSYMALKYFQILAILLLKEVLLKDPNPNPVTHN